MSIKKRTKYKKCNIYTERLQQTKINIHMTVNYKFAQ